MQLVWLLIFGSVFLILSVYDVRSKRIPAPGFITVAVLSVLCLILNNEGDLRFTDIIFSCMPGLVLVVLSILSDGKIGVGDGLLIACLGPGLGLERIAYVLMGALLAVSVFGGILLISRRGRKNTEIPFVPFITVGLGVMGCVFTG